MPCFTFQLFKKINAKTYCKRRTITAAMCQWRTIVLRLWGFSLCCVVHLWPTKFILPDFILNIILKADVDQFGCFCVKRFWFYTFGSTVHTSVCGPYKKDPHSPVPKFRVKNTLAWTQTFGIHALCLHARLLLWFLHFLHQPASNGLKYVNL